MLYCLLGVIVVELYYILMELRKMTEEEAIRRIEEFALYHAIRELPNSALTVRAFEMAIEALEKQSKNREQDKEKT